MNRRNSENTPQGERKRNRALGVRWVSVGVTAGGVTARALRLTFAPGLLKGTQNTVAI